MIDPESVTTEIVKAALWVYRAFYTQASECVCKTSGFCAPCNWRWQVARLQRSINGSGLSVPIPVIDLVNGDKPEIPNGNPLTLEQPFFKIVRYREDLDTHARQAAQSLLRAGLPTFYLDLSKAMDLTLAHQSQAVDDIALFAPVLIYCDNYDKRGSGISRMLQRLYSRSFGICYLIEQEGL